MGKTRILILRFLSVQILWSRRSSRSHLGDEQAEILDNLHAVDVIESDEEEEIVGQRGKIPALDFS